MAEREIPQLVTSGDLVERIGLLTVDVLNRDKFIEKLFDKVDKTNVQIEEVTKEFNNVTQSNLSHERDLKAKDKEINDCKKTIADKEMDINNRNNTIHELQKSLKGIEAEAVINQEEVRKELMETRNELSALKVAIKSKPKGVKKKKTSAKPARA